MGTAGNALIQGIDRREIVAALDPLHAYELISLHWALALKPQLTGMAVVMIGDELDDVVEQALAHARSLAERAAQLGGAVTADPSELVARAGVDQFALPSSTSDAGAILGYALDQVRGAIRAYGEAMRLVAGKDEITHRLLLHILRDHIGREDAIEAVLLNSRAPETVTV
jgi:ferritin-like protein